MGAKQPQPLVPLFVSSLIRILVTLAFLACVTVFADARYAPVQAIARVLASCGSRTLYGYYLHMVLRFLVTTEISRSNGRSFQSIHPLLAIVAVVLFTAALCSPFSERCFGWLVSPQWILDAMCACITPATPGIVSSKQHSEKQQPDTKEHVPCRDRCSAN